MIMSSTSIRRVVVMKNGGKVFSFQQKPKKVSFKSQDQIFSENRKRRQEIINKMDREKKKER